jgi:hypothetical protein
MGAGQTGVTSVDDDWMGRDDARIPAKSDHCRRRRGDSRRRRAAFLVRHVPERKSLAREVDLVRGRLQVGEGIEAGIRREVGRRRADIRLSRLLVPLRSASFMARMASGCM